MTIADVMETQSAEDNMCPCKEKKVGRETQVWGKCESLLHEEDSFSEPPAGSGSRRSFRMSVKPKIEVVLFLEVGRAVIAVRARGCI